MGWIGSAVYLVAPIRPPMMLIFSIAIGADYSFYVKSIATYAPTFRGYNNSVLARVERPSLTSYFVIKSLQKGACSNSMEKWILVQQKLLYSVHQS